MAFSLEDLHTPKNVQEMEKVVLWEDTQSTAGTLTLNQPPTGFEYYIIQTRIGGILIEMEHESLLGNRLTGQLSASQTDRLSWLTGGSEDSTSINLLIGSGWQTGNDQLRKITGYRRKFTTTTTSRTIELGTIGLNESILLVESDLGSEFFNSNGTIKESVKTELWLYTGSRWFHADSVIYNSDVAGRYGARGGKFNDDDGTCGVLVRTGNQTTNGLNAAGCLTASSTNLDSAPARLVVSMGERYAPTLAS